MHFDVFNGDADGICALLQLRQTFPCDSKLVTGVKREIDLLRHVSVNDGDTVSVLDISLDKNKKYHRHHTIITNHEIPRADDVREQAMLRRTRRNSRMWLRVVSPC